MRGWVEIAIATVLFLEHLRAERIADRRLSRENRDWWKRQRLHGICQAFRLECQDLNSTGVAAMSTRFGF